MNSASFAWLPRFADALFPSSVPEMAIRRSASSAPFPAWFPPRVFTVPATSMQKSTSLRSLPVRPAPTPLAARQGETFPVSRLGGVFRRTPSHSKSIWQARSAAESTPGKPPSRPCATPTKNTLRRRWATPNHWASRTRHAIALLGPTATPAPFHFPPWGLTKGSSAPTKAAMKLPKELSGMERTPGTFSQTT